MDRNLDLRGGMRRNLGVSSDPNVDWQIAAIYLSPGHQYFGRHGQEPESHGIESVSEVECVAGKGLVGDRFFGHKEGYKGQVTFFSEEVYLEARAALGAGDREASAFRRNVLTRGVDLNAWVGCRFRLQGMLFEGVEECRPCYWMETAFAVGAEVFLKGRGGLRVRVLEGGRLRVNAPAGAVL